MHITEWEALVSGSSLCSEERPVGAKTKALLFVCISYHVPIDSYVLWRFYTVCNISLMRHMYFKNKVSNVGVSSFLHNQEQVWEHQLKQKFLNLMLWTPSHTCKTCTQSSQVKAPCQASYEQFFWIRAEGNPGWISPFSTFCKFPHSKTSACVCYQLTQQWHVAWL